MHLPQVSTYPSTEEIQLIERFSKHSSEMSTFLQLGGQSSTLSDTPEFGQATSTTPLQFGQGFDYKEICTRYELNPEEFFLGAYILTLRRYTGQDSLSFCVLVDDDTVLPIATNLSIDMDLPTFFQFLKKELNFFKTFKTTDFQKLFANQETSDILQYPSQMFIYRTQGKETFQNFDNKSFPFSLQVTENNANIQGVSLSWNKSLLEKEVANLFVSNFINCCVILAGSTKISPISITLKTMEIMCDEEKALLSSFQRNNLNNDSMPHSIISLFDQNYALNPEKIAINETHAQYSYHHLWTASCRIAEGLLARFTPQQLASSPLVLVMDKTFASIASILGVWRAGGHFLPIDVNLQENLSRVLKSKSICPLAILTNLESSQLHFEIEGQNIISVHNLLSTSTQTDVKLEPQPSTSPAYITMTSGSTGQPKVCILTHGGLMQFISSAREEFDLNPATNILQWVSFSFDVFISDLCKSLLCTNGSLTMLSSLERLDVSKINQLVNKFGVNFIQMTPQFALFACQEVGEGLMTGVRTLALGGESLSWKTLQQLKQYLHPATKVYNCYGLTEATIESTVFLIPNEEEEIKKYQRLCRYVPIGAPMRGIKVQIQDPLTLLPSPIGSCGTLTISGVTVGSGDFFSADLTNNEPTLFTGDTVSWLPNGVIQFRDRDSAQILKASGLRINTAELESRVLDVAADLSMSVDLAVALVLNVDDQTEVLTVVLKASQSSESEDVTALRDELKKQLPYYMVPHWLFPMPTFPMTQNGKIDRKLLEIQSTTAYQQFHKCATPIPDADDMTPTENYLLQKLLFISGNTSDIQTKANLKSVPFRDAGFTSFQLMKFSNTLLQEKVSNFEGILDIFTYPTIQLLASKIDSKCSQPSCPIPPTLSSPTLTSPIENDPICIVGLSFRLPGNVSGSIPDFWNSLSSGKNFVRELPQSRAHHVLSRMTTPFSSGAVPASFFESIDQFDHEFFRIASSEAKHMCPEQRLFLELSTEALVDAGYNLSTIQGSNIAVYATASEIEYGIIDTSLEGVAVVGRQSSVVPSRLSYTYNLSGGNYVVDTACSAALTVLEQAVRDLKVGSCEAAVVGGVNIYLYPAKDGLMGTNLIHSPNSTCLPFDEGADGTASGEGAFAYVLKRMSAAKLSGDCIYATIESVTSNAVGRGNGITAPSVDSQVSVIQKALDQARITIDDLDFLETHGTGTILGDQIELCALNTVFSSRINPSRLTLGACKQQFGHLDMSAAFLGMLKATCALSFNSSPKMGHITKPSKYLDLSVFQTGNNQIVDWSEKKSDKAYAGVSAYGLSGTNCHSVISIQKANLIKSTSSGELCHFLLPVEERRVTLDAMCGIYSRYAQFYLDNSKSNSLSQISLEDMCGTQVANLVNQNTDPSKVVEVAVLSANSLEELIKKLNSIEKGVTVFGTNQIEKLNSSQLQKYLPVHSEWRRVPALPKFFYKPFSHWLDPIKEELTPQIMTQNNNSAQLVSLQLQLAKKSAEIHTLVEAAHKLERMLHQFTIGLLTDLPTSIMVSNEGSSKSQKFPDFTEDTFAEHGYGSMSPSPTPSEEDNIETTSDSSLLVQEDLTYESTLRMVRTIWQDCLGCDEISESDIFRNLGGDSLLTVQMSKVISRTFGIQIKAADAFSNPTLASFTSLVFMHKLSTINPKEMLISSLNDPKFEGMPLNMLLFPGQGSQKVGMFQSLSTCLAAAPIFEEAKQITGIDLLALSNHPESFQNTEFVQVALFVGSLAKVAALRAENPSALQHLRAVCGLSVGEFAALVFAEAIDFKDALKIVQYRGKVMQQQIESSSTGMISIFGPEANTFAIWLENNQEFMGMEFCTYLASNQFAIGGPLETCQRLVELLTKDEKLSEQLGIIDVRLLKVAGAFHTKYMKEAGQKTAAMIDTLTISFPKLAVIMNYDGGVAINKESIRFNLKKQTSCPVLFKECMMTAYQMGIRKFTEISPSSVLTPIVKNRIKGIKNVETTLVRF